MGQDDLDAIRTALSDFVTGEIFLRGTSVGPDDDLFAAGFDSMSLARVLVFVEERFGVVIPDEEVVVDEVATLDKLARFVHERVRRAR